MTRRRTLGLTGLSVSEIGLGCSELGRPLVHRRRADWIRLLHRAFDLGINFFDTADSYRHGVSERLLGYAFRDRRNSVVICTKVGYPRSHLGGMLESLPSPLQHVRHQLNRLRISKSGASTRRQCLSSVGLYEAVIASLRRLETDRVDLLLLHDPPVDELESDDSARIFERLVAEGKVRYLGVSAGCPRVARRAANLPWVSTLQLAYNILDHEDGENVIRSAADMDVGIIARLLLARGQLTPKRAPATGTRRVGNMNPTALDNVTDALACLAEESGRSLTAMAILFVLSNPAVSCGLIGTTQTAHLEQAVAATGERPLSDQEIRRILRITHVPNPTPNE